MKLHWFKGNLHTHSDRSDGDAPPRAVAEWYKGHGYDFFALSDHHRFCGADDAELRSLCDGSFLIVPSEEVCFPAPQPVHVNGLFIREVIERPEEGDTVRRLQWAVDAIRAQGGVPQLNHPNFRWAFTDAQMAQVRGWSLLEVFNGHPAVNNDGGDPAPATETMWDALLSAGMRVFAVAVDDAHHYHEFSPKKANPGRGWVVAAAETLTLEALRAALEAGRFYASTGPEIAAIETDASRLRVVTPGADAVEFIGRHGRTLDTIRFRGDAADAKAEAVYRFVGDEGYVRARVRGRDNAGLAWTQPVFLG